MARGFDVAVMHDFFVDRLVHAESLQGLTRLINAKARDGGGGIHEIGQTEVRGGNAVNLAHALARLGLRTLLITHVDGAHERLLRQTFEGLDVELRVKPLRAGLTVAFEERVNVMLGDGGGAAEFGPSLLDQEDWEGLRAANVVCSVNWAANKRGTELLVALRKRLGKEKAIFFDPADFRERRLQFKELLRLIKKEKLVEWISMNEQEGLAAANLVGLKSRDLGQVCRGLAKALGVVFDLHATKVSYSSEGLGVTSARVARTKARRLTGAGDVWDAGAIYGRLRKMDEQRRLVFANAAAKLYLESDEPLPPSAVEVLDAMG